MLKQLSEVMQADPRFDDMVAEITDTGVRLMTLEDYHADITSVELDARVPRDIRDAFDRARNAYLYSWFAYDLTTLAQAQGYAVLEFALRTRLGQVENGKRRAGLDQLIHAARVQGLLDGLKPLDHVVETSHGGDLTRLLDTMRRFRNELMHGSTHLNVPGEALYALRDCASVINHIFR